MILSSRVCFQHLLLRWLFPSSFSTVLLPYFTPSHCLSQRERMIIEFPQLRTKLRLVTTTRIETPKPSTIISTVLTWIRIDGRRTMLVAWRVRQEQSLRRRELLKRGRLSVIVCNLLISYRTQGTIVLYRTSLCVWRMHWCRWVGGRPILP